MAKPAALTALSTNSGYYDSISHAWGFLEGSGTSIDSRAGSSLTFSPTGIGWTTIGGEPAILANDKWSSYMSMSSSTTFLNRTSWSIAFRAKLTSTSSGSRLLSNSNSGLHYVAMQPGGSGVGKLRVNTSGGGVYIVNNPDYGVDANYAIVCDIDISQVLFYKNGSLLGGVEIIDPDSTGFTINSLCGDVSSTGDGLEGTLTYMYIWNGRALDSTEVSDLNTDPYRIYSSTASMRSHTPPVSRANLLHYLGR